MPTADPDGDAPPPPTARACLEQAGDRGGANAAATVAGEPPSGDVIPISADDPVTTPRGAPRSILAVVFWRCHPSMSDLIRTALCVPIFVVFGCNHFGFHGLTDRGGTAQSPVAA